MVLTFRDYQSNDIDFNELGQINESHQYADSICSVMDKLTFYVKRSVALETSNLNESAKRAYDKLNIEYHDLKYFKKELNKKLI